MQTRQHTFQITYHKKIHPKVMCRVGRVNKIFYFNVSGPVNCPVDVSPLSIVMVNVME